MNGDGILTWAAGDRVCRLHEAGKTKDHFIQSCKEGKPTCADFGYASAITEFLLLGHLAIRAGVGAKVEWDSANLRCPNLPELNRWVKRECRAGW
jgi:hypothetical protein